MKVKPVHMASYFLDALTVASFQRAPEAGLLFNGKMILFIHVNIFIHLSM